MTQNQSVNPADVHQLIKDARVMLRMLGLNEDWPESAKQAIHRANQEAGKYRTKLRAAEREIEALKNGEQK